MRSEPRHSRANCTIDDPDFPKCPRRQYSASNRRARSDDQTRDEVIVPSEAVGYIIGKHGETIKSITGSSGTMVAMDKYFPGPDRKFDITGSPAAVAHCREMILRKIEVVRERSHENRSSTAGQEYRRGPPRTQSKSSGHMDDSYEMWIPQHKIGMIIGSGGGNIRSINERSGALATVVNDSVDGDRKLVLIQGSPSAIQYARQLIIDLIEGPSSAGYSRPPPYREERSYRDLGEREMSSCDDDGNYPPKSVYIPRACVGQVIGKNGSMIRQLQARSRAVIRVSPDEESGDSPDRLVTISGHPRVVETAHAMIMKIIERGPAENVDSYSDRREPDMGDSRHHNAAFRRRSGPVEQTFSLSAEHIGLLIGKNGVTINDIQNRSGAIVEVTGKHESERESSTRRVSIVGTKAQVKIARILIEERLGLDDSESEGANGATARLVRISEHSDSQKENRGDNARRANITTPAKPTDAKTTPAAHAQPATANTPAQNTPAATTAANAGTTNSTATATAPALPPPCTAPQPAVINTGPQAAGAQNGTAVAVPTQAPTALLPPGVASAGAGGIPAAGVGAGHRAGFHGFAGGPFLGGAGAFPGGGAFGPAAGGGPMFGEGGMMHFGQFGAGGAHMAASGGFGAMGVASGGASEGEQGKARGEAGGNKQGAAEGRAGNAMAGGKVGAGHAPLGVNGFYGYHGPHGMMYAAAPPPHHMYGGFGFAGAHGPHVGAGAQAGFGFAGQAGFVGGLGNAEAVAVAAQKSVIEGKAKTEGKEGEKAGEEAKEKKT